MFSIWKDVVFKNYANFKGRLSRKNYWLFVLAECLLIIGVYLVFLILAALAGFDEEAGIALLLVGLIWLYVIILATLLPMLSAGSRRLQDAGYSGLFLLLQLIPYLGSIAVFIMTLLPGTKGDNKFGPPDDEA